MTSLHGVLNTNGAGIILNLLVVYGIHLISSNVYLLDSIQDYFSKLLNYWIQNVASSNIALKMATDR